MKDRSGDYKTSNKGFNEIRIPNAQMICITDYGSPPYAFIQVRTNFGEYKDYCYTEYDSESIPNHPNTVKYFYFGSKVEDKDEILMGCKTKVHTMIRKFGKRNSSDEFVDCGEFTFNSNDFGNRVLGNKMCGKRIYGIRTFLVKHMFTGYNDEQIVLIVDKVYCLVNN